MLHEVFICYAAHDKAVAEAICDALESRHIKCWIAPRDVLPGTEWAETIVDALDGSRVLVLVLSSSSNTSPQVIREVGRAASNGTPILPLRIDDVAPSKAMDYFISSHQWLYAQTGPLKKHLQRLADTVQQILARPPQAVTEITEAKEVKKAKEAEERARKEAEKAAAKEREKRETRESKEKAKREAEEARKAREAKKRPPVFMERPAKPVKVGKPLLKRWWLWSGAVVVLVALIFVFVFVFVLRETAEQHYNAGVALLEEGQYEQAILELDKAIELDPTIEVDPAYAAAYHDRGLNYSNQGKYDLAIADLTRALELDPAIEVDPAYAAAYHDQGQTYSNIKDDIISSIVGSCDTPGTAIEVYIEGNYAYIADGNAGLQIIDITDKKNPNIVGSCGGNTQHAYAEDVYVEGNYAYIAGDGLQVIDITDKKNPNIIGICETNAHGVYVKGNYAYVAGEDGLQIMDIADKKSPNIIGNYKLEYIIKKEATEWVNDIYVEGNYAYIAVFNSEMGLRIIDITDKENPSIIGSCDNTPLKVYGVYVEGNYAYITDKEGGVFIIDKTNKEKLYIVGIVGSRNTPGGGFDIFGGLDIYVEGNYAYATTWDPGFIIIDITDKKNPNIIGSCKTPGDALGLYIEGKYAYIADNEEGLQIIDTSIRKD